jgi:hypothetical protein
MGESRSAEKSAGVGVDSLCLYNCLLSRSPDAAATHALSEPIIANGESGD